MAELEQRPTIIRIDSKFYHAFGEHHSIADIIRYAISETGDSIEEVQQVLDHIKESWDEEDLWDE